MRSQVIVTALAALVWLWPLAALRAQTPPCRAPLAPVMLEVSLQSMDSLALESARVEEALLLLKDVCVTAEQGRAILQKLALSSSRLVVAQTLWHRTFDARNFHIIPPLLSSEKHREALAAYIAQHPQADSTAITPADSIATAADSTATPTPLRAELRGYYGPIGCRYVMGDAALAQAKSAIRSKSFPDQRKQTGKEIIGQYCLSTAQLLQLLALYDFESDRLEMARFAFAFTHDQGNSYTLMALFNHERNAELYIQWLSEQTHGPVGTVTRPVPPAGVGPDNGCGQPAIADADLQQLLTVLAPLSFADGKEKVLRYWLQGRCLATQHVIAILQLFGNDADRLRMAKALFAYTVDSAQYFMVNDVFAEDPARLELNAFIATKH